VTTEDTGRVGAPPSGTTVRLLLLTALVAAGGLATFNDLYVLVPARWSYFTATLAECFADPRIGLPAPDGFEQARALLATCQEHAFYDRVLWIGYGFLLLAAVTAVLYALHPVWIRWRERLARYRRDDDTAEVLDHLNALCAKVGLTTPPSWYVRAVPGRSGLAFGVVGRRRVRLDAGLLVHFDRDRARFDAVVLHELGHLRNRDIDKTYLTIALWWAFVAVVVAPFAVLVGHTALSDAPPAGGPDPVLTEYLVDRPYALGQALVLAVLVYLVRNAVLRVRELHADVFLATHHDGDPAPFVSTGRAAWWARLGIHPPPSLRVAAVRDACTALRPTLWEIAAVGFSAGLLGNNLDLLARALFLEALGKLNLFWGQALTGLLLGPPLTAFLLMSLWRAAASAPDGRLPARDCLLHPLMLAAGLCGGYAVPLLTHSFRDTPYVIASSRVWWGDVGALAVATMPVLVGGVLLALWFRSASASKGTAAGGVVIAGVVVALPWFVAWYASFAGEHSDDALTCWLDAGFFHALSCPQAFTALNLVELNPVLLPGTALLWLIPLRHADRRAPWLALGIGAVGGLVTIGASAVAARVADHDSGPVHWRTYVAIAMLTQALVALIVARFVRPAVLALLATSVTAVLAAAGQSLFSPVARCLGLIGTAPAHCLPRLAADLHTITLYGLLAAIPAVLLGAARLRRQEPTATPPSTCSAPTRAVIASLVILIVTATVVTAPTDWANWMRWGFG
jgi:Zn-dependent protease with chaperone function